MVDQESPKAAAPRIGPIPALLLSMFIMPGLGQVVTGRLYRGMMMMGGMALWLPWAIINLGRDLNKVVTQIITENPETSLSLGQVQSAMAPLTETSLSFIFLPLVIIWFWALGDSLGYLIRTRSNKS